MATRLSTRDRVAEDPDTEPTQLQELLQDRRRDERERNSAGWRRNLSLGALLVAVALVGMLVFR